MPQRCVERSEALVEIHLVTFQTLCLILYSQKVDNVGQALGLCCLRCDENYVYVSKIGSCLQDDILQCNWNFRAGYI